MQPAPRFTEDEYLEHERASATKSELVNGAIVAMAGGSPRHNAIAANVMRALNERLENRPCIVFSSDQRVHVEETGLYTYPDITVACDKLRFHPKSPDTLLNPRVIIEVLSESTQDYDRGAKFAHYRSIPSLAEVVFVSQDERRVEHYRRLETGQWVLTDHRGDGAVVAFPTLGFEVPLAEFYRKVDLIDAARQ